MFQKLARAAKACALLFSIAFVLVITAFGLVEDSLFFQSDPRSAFAVVSALSLGLFVVLSIVCTGLAMMLPKFREGFEYAAGYVLATLMLGSFAYFVFAWLDKSFRIFGLFRKLEAEWLFFVLWALLLALSALLIARLRKRREIAQRTALLTFVATPIAVAGLGLHLVTAHLSAAAPAADAGQPRHAILIVLDAWPAQHLHAYNPAAPETELDALLNDKALVFRNVHTNAAWTNAYFGALYKGTPSYTFARLDIGQRIESLLAGATGSNLLREIQRQGAQTTVMSYHRNGLPEGSASTVSDYDGLRSVFLSFEHVPLLEALGIRNYNLVIPGPGAGTVWGDQRKTIVRDLLAAPVPVHDNPLTELLLPEMRRLTTDSSRSFAIFHTGWALGAAESLPAAWDKNLPDGNTGRVTRTARKRDYRYDPENEWYATRMRHRQSLVSRTVSRKITDFVRLAEEQGLLEDTLLVFTADHGSMYGKGRVWYGFHPEEEVLRVPFFMIGAGETGTNDGIFESIDLTRTLVEYFGGAGKLHERARSMFAGESKPYTTSITLRSDANREWFLAIYRDGRKFLFNIHPNGDGRAMEISVEGFEGTVVNEGAKVLESAGDTFDTALADYGLKRADIHADLRQAAP